MVSGFADTLRFFYMMVEKMSHEVPLILEHFFAHVLWTTIFQILTNSPLVAGESFSTYYGEVYIIKTESEEQYEKQLHMKKF